MNESNAYRALAFSTAPVGGLLVVLGWIAGGGGLVIQVTPAVTLLLIGGVSLMALGPWLVLSRYRIILRRRRSNEAEE